MKYGDKVYRVQTCYGGNINVWEGVLIRETPKHLYFEGEKDRFLKSVHKEYKWKRDIGGHQCFEMYTDDLIYGIEMAKEWTTRQIETHLEIIATFKETRDFLHTKIEGVQRGEIKLNELVGEDLTGYWDKIGIKLERIIY